MYSQEVRVSLKSSLIEKLGEWLDEQNDDIDVWQSENTTAFLAEAVINTLEAARESAQEQADNAG